MITTTRTPAPFPFPSTILQLGPAERFEYSYLDTEYDTTRQAVITTISIEPTTNRFSLQGTDDNLEFFDETENHAPYEIPELLHNASPAVRAALYAELQATTTATTTDDLADARAKRASR